MRSYRQIASKGLKTKVMLEQPLLRPFIPHTLWFTKDGLKQMLEVFPTVFVKPDKGGGGAGIVRIQRITAGYRLCFRQKCRNVSREGVDRALSSLLLPHKQYLIQEGIDLATIDSRPFDVRVLLQKPGSRWVISGMIAKVAARRQFVTNHCKGGSPVALGQALERMEGVPVKPRQIIEELIRVSFLTAKVLDARFPGIRELGLDVGIDRQGRLHIFEVNTRPLFQMFRKIQVPGVYKKILHRHRQVIN
ncbi:YheC/YheD family protein [Desmospora activa]|uniref:YheC/D-like protein n=1 Tax=Desmospora activa DSM 45169 TaxID=1121389 RepID=A0A2T4Z4Q2_9BACL|nr:YheC/YheD family protein [Desmospora activa]PTM56867.1 YheC/D-like protein [Desmospora activa DSM 45169]